MELGKQIRKYRQEAQLSQEELAERIYVSRQTVSNWENDKSYPDVNSLVILSETFHISLDKLIKGDLDMMKEYAPDEYNRLKAEYESAYGSLEDSSSESKIGFNVGAGLEYDLSKNISIFAEGRYQIVSDFDQTVIAAGLSFKF